MLFLGSDAHTIGWFKGSPMSKALYITVSRHNVCVTAAALLFSASGLHASVFDVTQWDLGTGVLASFPHGAGVSSQTVMNPFIANHVAIDGNSSATTTYSFAWNASVGDFLVQVAHRAADVDPSILRSASDGRIYVTANTDLLFTIDGNYSYSLPVDPMLTIFNMGISDIQPPHDSPIGFGNSYDTVNGAPASGSFPISGQAILPAGHTWSISYIMEVFALGGLSGQIAQGDGYLHFTLQEAIPEPATLLPLALAAVLVRVRRASRRTLAVR